MKKWFFERKFNRFDLVAMVASVMTGRHYGFWAGAVAVVVLAMLSVIGENSLKKETP